VKELKELKSARAKEEIARANGKASRAKEEASRANGAFRSLAAKYESLIKESGLLTDENMWLATENECLVADS